MRRNRYEVGTVAAQTGALFSGIVGSEGGGLSPALQKKGGGVRRAMSPGVTSSGGMSE
jgi:hypothetical protein